MTDLWYDPGRLLAEKMSANGFVVDSILKGLEDGDKIFPIYAVNIRTFLDSIEPELAALITQYSPYYITDGTHRSIAYMQMGLEVPICLVYSPVQLFFTVPLPAVLLRRDEQAWRNFEKRRTHHFYRPLEKPDF